MRFFLYSHKTQKTWEEEDMAYWYRHLGKSESILRHDMTDITQTTVWKYYVFPLCVQGI